MDDFFLLTEKDSTQQIGNELQVIFRLLPDFLIHNESGKYIIRIRNHISGDMYNHKKCINKGKHTYNID